MTGGLLQRLQLHAVVRVVGQHAVP
jgi:hypothetical protein